MAKQSSWAASLLAGALAGVAATLVMDGYWAVQAKWQRQPSKQKPEEATTAKVAADLLRRAGLDAPSPAARRIGGQVVHWGYGTTWGLLAGLARQAGLRLDLGYGQPLGAALWGLGDTWALYRLGYAKHPREYPVSIHVQALCAHLFFGAGLWAALTALHHLSQSEMVDLSQSEMVERAGLPKVA